MRRPSPRSWWRRLVADRPIVTRLVLAVAAAMTVVLVASAAFVYWRVAYALDRQLDQDLTAYQEVVLRAVHNGVTPPSDTPGEQFQVYDLQGRVVSRSSSGSARLLPTETVRAAARGETQRVDVGDLLPATDTAYRVVVSRTGSPTGPVVVGAAISRHKHDEALRELVLQLALTGLLTLAAASFVGYRTARAALDPVERYRRAAAGHGDEPGHRLPVPAGRDDELTRLGRTFNDLLDRLEESHERERQFLADASHELRTPLTRMRTELEYALARPREAGDLREALQSVDAQVRRLVELANALLDLEELRSSDAVVREPVDLSLLVGQVAERFRPSFERAGRVVEVDAEQGDDGLVAADGRWLDLAVDNLMDNALRHGEGDVCIAVRRTGGAVRVEVTDEGPGFPPEFASQAFDRFSRAQRSRSTPGSGLGLALVRAVAEGHGGSASCRGSTVTLRFPDQGRRFDRER